MSLLEQIEQNPLLLDSEEVREQVRNFTLLDYNKAWNLYLLSKAQQAKVAKVTTAAKVRKPDPSKPLLLLPGLAALNVLQWWRLIACLVIRSFPNFENCYRKCVKDNG